MRGRTIHYDEIELHLLYRMRHLPRSEATKQFNHMFDRDVSVDNIKALYSRKGWKTGRSGRFEKGNIPHPNARMKSPNSTSFSKGHAPANRVALGAERISKDGYIEIKVAEPNPHTGAPTRFRHKHRVVWEREHGAIPANHAVIFLDGDKLNCTIDNLEMIDRATLARLNQNGYSSAPAALKPSILAMSKLQTGTHTATHTAKRRAA